MTTDSTDATRLPPTIEWCGDLDGCVRLIDQTLLPCQLVVRTCRTVPEIWEAIRSLRIRGAPAIGIAAAMGMVLGIRDVARCNGADVAARLKQSADYLRTSRPTAVNLFWALDRMERVAARYAHADASEIARRLLDEARAIHDEDRRACHAIGDVGASLIADGDGVLTHCNAGGLATAEFGTALAVLFAAHQHGRRFEVFVDETRPLLQGARLTAWELSRAGIATTVICDNMAAQVMREGRLQLVVTGADRIAANGDTANKIGTYGLAVLAHAHSIPFYIAAPQSTFDLAISDGSRIPIEQRDPREISHWLDRQTVPDGVAIYNPAFDVTPARLIAGIVTDRGLLRPPFTHAIQRLVPS